ncbi:MAG: DUF2807 domain-containing protein [Marinilabiliaceae bacterium]|nr:DUF2807 domain-containing protein [Marinilabiliaceae bacterium]
MRDSSLNRISVYFVIVSLSLMLSGCLDIRRSAMVKGSLTTTSQFRKVDSFDQLNICGHFSVNLVESKSPYLKVKANQKDPDIIYSEVKDRTLLISCADTEKKKSMRDNPELEIGYKQLKRIDLNGVIDLIAVKPIVFDTMSIMINGIGGLEASLDGHLLVADFNGPVSVSLKGSVDQARITMPGAGVVDAEELISNAVYFAMLGAGKADIYAREELKVKIMGAGIVRYHGQPESVSSNIGGIGRLTKVNVR